MWPPHKAINNVPSLQPFTLVQKRPCFSRNLLNLLVFSGGRLWYGKRAQWVKREIHWVQSSEGGIFVFAAPSWSWMRQFGHAVKWKIDLQTLNWFENKDTCLYLVFWFPVHLPFEKLAKTPHWHQTKQDPSYRLALEWFIQQFPLINYTLITYFQGNIKGNLPATSPRILTGKHSLGMVLPIGCQEKEIEADADGWSPLAPYSIRGKMGKAWMLLQKRVGHRLVWETCFLCSRRSCMMF